MTDPAEGAPPRSRSSSTSSNSSRGEQSPASPLCLPQTLTQGDIHHILLENQKILQAIHQNQNLGKFSDCVAYLEILQRNILHLGRVADLPGFTGEDRNDWPPDIAHRWARDEFDRLRVAMSVYGIGNLELISRFVATKSVDEVVKMLPFFLNPPASQDPNSTRSTLSFPGQDANASRNLGYTTNVTVPAPQQTIQGSSSRIIVTAPDAPPATGTVTLSQLASMHTSGSIPNTDPNLLGLPNPHDIGSQSSTSSGTAFTSSMYGQSSLRYNTIPDDSSSMTGTLKFTMNTAAQSMASSASPTPSTTLHIPMSTSSTQSTTMSEANMGMSSLQAPNGVGTFGSFSAHSNATPAPSMTMVTFPGMDTSNLVTSGPTQPAISISMYDVPSSSANGSSSSYGSISASRNSFVAKSTGGYVPAPGQVHVNMDKTTLFTPSNPPRPGSPRSPRTPKSPKSPKSPASTAPHSPKSPKPDPT